MRHRHIIYLIWVSPQLKFLHACSRTLFDFSILRMWLMGNFTFVNVLHKQFVLSGCQQMVELYILLGTYVPFGIFLRSGESRVDMSWFKRTKTSNQILLKHLSFKFNFVPLTLDLKSRKQQTRKLVRIKKKVLLRLVIQAPSVFWDLPPQQYAARVWPIKGSSYKIGGSLLNLECLDL